MPSKLTSKFCRKGTPKCSPLAKKKKNNQPIKPLSTLEKLDFFEAEFKK